MHMTESQYKELLKESQAYLEFQIKECNRKYKFRSLQRMDYEQESCRMVFSDISGQPRVQAIFQIVGSLSGSSGTWLWSWDNEYLLDITIEDIWQVKEFGVENSIEKLSNPKWDASQEDAWEMTAISAYLLKAQGAYSFLSDDIRVFVVLREMSDIEK
jgi:hypothetical protein